MARGNTSAANLYLHKKIFLCAREKSRGEKCLCSQLQGWFYWCVWPCTLPLFRLLCQLALALPPSHSSQLSSLPALLAPGQLHSHSQAPLLHQLPPHPSGSRGFPCVSVMCIFCLLFQLFGVSDEFINFFIPSDRTQEPPQV